MVQEAWCQSNVELKGYRANPGRLFFFSIKEDRISVLLELALNLEVGAFEGDLGNCHLDALGAGKTNFHFS